MSVRRMGAPSQALRPQVPRQTLCRYQDSSQALGAHAVGASGARLVMDSGVILGAVGTQRRPVLSRLH